MSVAQELSMPVRCSFCRRSHDEVDKVVAGPGIFICDGCVALAAEIIAGAPATHEAVLPWEVEMPLEQVLATLGPVAAAGAQVEENLGVWVRKARSAGATWAQVGAALGMTRQSAWERFSGEE
ncbi:ClpX C4-type zinc finger protein [Actinokineospora spheciospongiae]|uniref:ClpX C4-type zinc finger protein n=1 Tax=Actinokineospora spheciospongiae TaxID=909613 RepID=UPI000D8D9BF3|nr:ClpX C4-type zinc finger protein [Actinokineospora spheciospongiae]PWW62175.1 ClpX C4-type zinc finger protein [Actinokineospora spheciospongiae]